MITTRLQRLLYGVAYGTHSSFIGCWYYNAAKSCDFAAITLDRSLGSTTATMGLRWEDYDYPFTEEAMAITGYPVDKGSNTMWKDIDQIRKYSDTFFWYAADTYGGQSGSPIYQSSYKCGTSTGYCAIGIHAYGTGDGEDG